MGAGASSSRVQRPLVDPVPEKRKPAKIPLNIALVAIVKIQTRFRIVLAKKAFEIVKIRVLEERRIRELIRLAKEAELDEITALVTSPSLRSVPGKINFHNRFLRKIATRQQLEEMKDDCVYVEEAGEPANVLSKLSPLDGDHAAINPLVGFVIKSRSNLTGKKIFINICHHDAVLTMVAAPVREVTDTVAAAFARDASSAHLGGTSSRPYTANSGYNFSVANGSTGHGHNHTEVDSMIQIGDVVLPSQEYEECFVRDDDAGLVPVDPRVRQEIAKQAIKFWNLAHNEDVAVACTFPKIKRGYFGDLLPLRMELKYRNVEHLPSALNESMTILRETASKEDNNLVTPFAVSRLASFHLPYATEFRSWVDISAVGTDLPVVDPVTGVSPVQVAASLAVITYVQSLDTHGHHLKLSSRDLAEDAVTEVRAQSFLPQVPLFGPAYAPQQPKAPTTTTMTATPSTSMLPAITSAKSNKVEPVSVLVQPAEPVAPEAVTPKLTPFAPQTPSHKKSSRSATIGPGTPSAAHRTLIGTSGASGTSTEAAPTPRGGKAWRPAGGTNITTTDSSSDENAGFSAALEHFSAGVAALNGVPARDPSPLALPQTVEEPVHDTAPAPPVAPVESHHTVPAFVVISQGVLYLYNRDPSRGHYYPFKPPKKRANRMSVEKSAPPMSLDELPFSPAKAKPPSPVEPAFRPLILYARIMLTEQCVTTSSCDRDTPSTHLLHFSAPVPDTAEEALALLFSHFGTALPGKNVTFKLRTYSEFRTWKAHLRSHLQVGRMVRKRVVSDYSGNMEVNRYLLVMTAAPKFGNLVALASAQKYYSKTADGVLSLFDEKRPEDNEGNNSLRTITLGDKVVFPRSEMREDNSTNVIVSLKVDELSDSTDTDHEFVFHRPYAMIETESNEFLESFQQHIAQARARLSATVLPLLEHKQGVSVLGQQCDIASVQLLVGGSDDVDSDDEEEDEAEAALRKHTLLTTFYLAHPFPEQHAKDTVDLILSHAHTDTSLPEPASAVHNEVHNVVVSHENEPVADEIISVLQKGTQTMPPFEIVLVGKMLYFFHAMRYYFSLNLSRLGDKLSHKRAKAVHIAEVLQLKAEVLRKRQKESVFYIDSSDDEMSDLEDPDDMGYGYGSVGGSMVDGDNLLRGESSASLMSRGALTPSRPANRPRGVARPRLVKSIDAAAPAIDDSSLEKARQAAKPVIVRTLKPSVAPPNYTITAWTIHLVSYDNRSYALRFKSAAEYETWRELLFEAGAEPIPEPSPVRDPLQASSVQIATMSELSMQVDSYDNNLKEDSLMQPETTENSLANRSRSEDFSTDLRDSSSVEALAPSTPVFAPPSSVVNKLDAKYVDVDAAKKYARLLRTGEQVLACGQVFKHDVLPPSKTTSSKDQSGSKQRRILVLTDLPRLLFLDPVGNIVRGNLELSSAVAKIDIKMSTVVDFEVLISGVTNRFTSTEIPEKNAVFWTTKIKQALGRK